MQSIHAVAVLNWQITEFLQESSVGLDERKPAIEFIQHACESIIQRLGIEGQVLAFGSSVGPLADNGSDLDLTLLVAESEDAGSQAARTILRNFAVLAPEYGFENVTTVFQAALPVLKFTDIRSRIEVDFSVGNTLGVRNSELLLAYYKYDERVAQLGRLVKAWTRRRELLGTRDGYLNSYAYVLLTIFYLQNASPPVVPNLQQLAGEEQLTTNFRLGELEMWDTRFLADVDSIPASQNRQSIGDLLMGFFNFYGYHFDWQSYAVCPRLHRFGSSVLKKTLGRSTCNTTWCIQDPFNEKHNLALNTTRACRIQILEEMREAGNTLTMNGAWHTVCPEVSSQVFYLKASTGQWTTWQAFLHVFLDCDVSKVHFPNDGEETGHAFLTFDSEAARRQAYSKNETFVANSCMQLHYTSERVFGQALSKSSFSVIEATLYKRRRQSLMARLMYVYYEFAQEEWAYDPMQSKQMQGRVTVAFPELASYQPGTLSSLMSSQSGSASGFDLARDESDDTPTPLPWGMRLQDSPYGKGLVESSRLRELKSAASPQDPQQDTFQSLGPPPGLEDLLRVADDDFDKSIQIQANHAEQNDSECFLPEEKRHVLVPNPIEDVEENCKLDSDFVALEYVHLASLDKPNSKVESRQVDQQGESVDAAKPKPTIIEKTIKPPKKGYRRRWDSPGRTRSRE